VARYRDQLPVIPESEWHKYYGRSDLAERVWDVLDQNGHGSCAAECVTGAITVVRELAGLQRIKLNPWTVYQFTSGGRDRGSNIGDNVRRSQSVGILPQDYWPRSKGLWTPLPAGHQDISRNYRSLRWLDIGSKLEFATSLFRTRPICYGRRGHAICALEWLEGDRVLYLNSWDEAWNGGGFGIDSWNSIASSIRNYGAYALIDVVDPSGEEDPVLAI